MILSKTKTAEKGKAIKPYFTALSNYTTVYKEVLQTSSCERSVELTQAQNHQFEILQKGKIL